MLISTKGRYALRILIDMAEHQSDSYIPLKDVAARQEISEKYLETIVKLLVKDGRRLPLKKGPRPDHCGPHSSPYRGFACPSFLPASECCRL